MSGIEVEFVIDSNDLEQLNAALAAEKASDVELLPDAGFVPLLGVVVVALIAVTGLANVCIKLSRLRRVGVIIDARGPVIRTQTDRALPSGTVLVFAPDGVRHELHEPSTMDLSALLQASAS